MKKILTALCILTSSLFIFPQTSPAVEWSKSFLGLGMPWGYGAIQTSDGGYALTTRIDYGSLNFDARLIRTNSSGDTLWTKTYGSTYIDETYQVKQLSNGGFLLCGVTTQFGNSGEAWLIKTDANGNIVWSKGFHPAQSTSANWDYFYDMVENADGSITAIGYAYLDGLEWQAWIVKVNSSGTMLWSKLFGEPFLWERLFALKATSDGGYIVVGDKHVTYGDTTSHDGWLLKFNSVGDTLWTKNWGGAQIDIFRSIDITSDGGYIISGERETIWGQPFKGWLVRTDIDGNILFNKTLTSGGLMSVIQTPSGFVTAGITSTPPTGGIGWILKTDFTGNILWEKFINESIYDEVINTIRMTTDGGYIIGGRSYSGPDSAAGWLLKLAPDITPVELSSFTAFAEDSYVMLNWITASETNNKHFEIQRSENGMEYSTIAVVAGNGTTTQSNFYNYTDKDLLSGEYFYRLRQVDYNGSFQYSNVITIMITPGEYALEQNYPNPFNPSTTISYRIPEAGDVTLKIYDMLGNEAATLVNEYKGAGKYKIDFEGQDLASGTYIYRLTVNNFFETRKMTLLK